MSKRVALATAIAVALAAFGRAEAYDGLVEKKTFTLPSYTTVGGQAIKDVKIGWESYGTLNADRSNAILITLAIGYVWRVWTHRHYRPPSA